VKIQALLNGAFIFSSGFASKALLNNTVYYILDNNFTENKRNLLLSLIIKLSPNTISKTHVVLLVCFIFNTNNTTYCVSIISELQYYIQFL